MIPTKVAKRLKVGTISLGQVAIDGKSLLGMMEEVGG